jgi:hypothetical protein
MQICSTFLWLRIDDLQDRFKGLFIKAAAMPDGGAQKFRPEQRKNTD